MTCSDFKLSVGTDVDLFFNLPRLTLKTRSINDSIKFSLVEISFLSFLV